MQHGLEEVVQPVAGGGLLGSHGADVGDAGGEPSGLRKWQFHGSSFAGRLILEHELSRVFPSQLNVSIEQFDSIHGTIGREININLVAHVNGFDFSRLGVQTEIRDVIAGVVGEFHTASCHARTA
jgi:hypothetical protein